MSHTDVSQVEHSPFAADVFAAPRRAAPLLLVIFGASGDLTRRKLVPALYSLTREGILPEAFVLLGVARSAQQEDAFRAKLYEGCLEHARHRPASRQEWEEFAARIFYQAGSYDDPRTYEELRAHIKELQQRFALGGNCLYYLSTPPVLFAPIVEQLGRAGLVRNDSSSTPDAPVHETPSPQRAAHAGSWRRVIIEKPFGRDLHSAQHLNQRLRTVLHESQIYRIDHYLGKETVQNLLVFRFANGIFEPLWNHRYIHHVQITSAESVGTEGRGGYFESAGILRDMVQNHLLQLLCLFGMEPPVSLKADAIRDEKVRLLRSLRPAQVRLETVRGQYQAGRINGHAVPGYREEAGVRKDSHTESFVALRMHVDNWRWTDVPVFLRAGKRMPCKTTEIAIVFRHVPRGLFHGASVDLRPPPNTLVIRIQPDEGISLDVQGKQPGPAVKLAPLQLDFCYGNTFGGGGAEAYERLLLDAMLGDSTLFIRGDEAEAAWEFVSPILAAWEEDQHDAIKFYAAGAWGPSAADRLIEPSGAQWRNPPEASQGNTTDS